MTAYLAPDFSIKDIAAFMPSRCSACGTGRRRAGWCWSRGAFEGAVGGGARRISKGLQWVDGGPRHGPSMASFSRPSVEEGDRECLSFAKMATLCR